MTLTRVSQLVLASTIAALALGASEHLFAASSLLGLRRSVFKIQVVSQDPNFLSPWKLQPAGAASGSGFFIGDDRVLTNAHVVANASFITLQRDGDPQPVPAYVLFIAHDADLALLTTKQTDYFKDLVPMQFGTMPKLRSPVSTIGYPTGGDQISITEGIVSRVGYRRYVHAGNKDHILVQVDSAINAGNSGGPVIQGRLVVGVAFQSFTSAENTGYIIPTPVIRRFLLDVEDGRYDGHPDDGITYARLSVVNPGTAEYHGLPRDQKPIGVKIIDVAPWAPTAGKLQAGDIILKVDDQEVGVDGKIVFENERVDFQSLFDLRLIGDSVKFVVSRDGKMTDVVVQVTKNKPHYFNGDIYAKHPKFLVHGGLIFTVLSRSYLKTWGAQWYRRAPVLLRYLDAYSDYEPGMVAGEDIIMLAGRLPHPVNTYAGEQKHGVLHKVDGQVIKSMSELAERLKAPGSEFLVLEFLGDIEPIVLNRADAIKANPEIAKSFGVSPDIWLDGLDVDATGRSESLAPLPATVKP